MQSGLPYLDILIFGVIAVFLILRLKNILGTKTGYDSSNIEKENQEMPTFYKQKEFTGTITFSNFDQQVDILISSFERRELEQMYM